MLAAYHIKQCRILQFNASDVFLWQVNALSVLFNITLGWGLLFIASFVAFVNYSPEENVVRGTILIN